MKKLKCGCVCELLANTPVPWLKHEYICSNHKDEYLTAIVNDMLQRTYEEGKLKLEANIMVKRIQDLIDKVEGEQALFRKDTKQEQEEILKQTKAKIDLQDLIKERDEMDSALRGLFEHICKPKDEKDK